MNMRNFAVWALIGVLLMGLLAVMNSNPAQAGADRVDISEFYEMAEQKQLSEVVITPNRVTGLTTSNQRIFAQKSQDLGAMRERMIELDVPSVVDDPDTGFNLGDLIMGILPILLILGILLFFMRQMQSGSGGRGAMSFGKSKAKLLTQKEGRVTVEDVAGVDEAKEELEEVVDFLKDPTKFQRLGGKIPKGALLIGPPGTGKTLLARAIAGEAGVPFFTISGSDFVEMFVGVGASRVRDMFEQAKRNAPCIIFIDEIDAVGRSRGAGLGGGNDEREQTLNQLLVEMDGFEANEGIIIVAATNRPDVLDPALLRPGRFDRQVTVGNPDVVGREKILKVHMRNVPLSKDVLPKVIARGTPGFSGADLANLVNEAALLAARRGKRVVSAKEFDDAKDKIMMGAERRTMVMTAWHEAGHAIVSLKVPAADPIHKATIIPRGRALGMVQYLPEADQISMSRKQMTSRLATAMGGRVAEELKFGDDNVTSGASSDIQMATRLARAMVTQWGLSDVIGPIDYGDDQGQVFLGQQLMQSSSVSEETSRKIEEEVRKLVQGGMDDARRIMTEYNDQWTAIAEALIEYETLTGDEILALVNDGIQPSRPDDSDDTPAGKASAVPVIGKRRKDTGLGGEPEPA
jgi:cell division protease FtsH